LRELSIPRCYKTPGIGTVKFAELHHFADSSFDGYGECSYLKLVDDNNQVNTSLVMAKARVTPKKTVTIPRLELTAALTAARVGKFLENELRYDNLEHWYYTDSKVVLGYILNESRRFHVYVANRVQEIRDFTTPDRWRHVKTTLNPADLASRGTTAMELVNNPIWWKGPELLHHPEPTQPSYHQDTNLDPNDPEIKRVTLKTQTLQD
jgi:hypothetical protein